MANPNGIDRAGPSLPEKFGDLARKVWTDDDGQLLLVKELEEHLRDHEDCREGWLLLGDFISDDPERQLECFYTALRLDPSCVAANGEIARLLAREGASRAALRYHLNMILDHGTGDAGDEVFLELVVMMAEEQTGLDDLAARAKTLGQQWFPESDWSKST